VFLAVGELGRFELRYFDLGVNRGEAAPVSPPQDFFDMASV
jgi:hypothetical protein